jgi:alkaline phosphatase
MHGRAQHGGGGGWSGAAGWCAALALCLAGAAVEPALAEGPARHVILFIGDGMGPVQVQVGTLFAGEALSFETMPYRATMTTGAANAPVTDSAAAGTAMATGRKANNGVISQALPGDGAARQTILEVLQERQGRRTGLVTTAFLTDATPAVFGAHEESRGLWSEIAADYLTASRPEVLLGGGGNGLTPAAAEDAGYAVATNWAELLVFTTNGAERVAGLFGEGSMPYAWDGLGDLPTLEEMTEVALGALSGATNGFFLMVEGGLIDHACHIHDLNRCIAEVLAFSRAVALVTNWAAGRADTLVVVTADHETGGLQVVQDMGAGTNPVVSWSTGGHTATPVPVYAWGAGAERVTNVIDNTGIFDSLVAASLGAPMAMEVVVSPTNVMTRWAGVGGHTCELQAGDLVSTNWGTRLTVYAPHGPLVLTDTNAPLSGPTCFRLQTSY